MTETGAPQGRPAHGHHKTQAIKKRLAEVAPCAVNLNRATKPNRCFAAMGRDYAPDWTGASEREFLGSFIRMKGIGPTNRLKTPSFWAQKKSFNTG